MTQSVLEMDDASVVIRTAEQSQFIHTFYQTNKLDDDIKD